jgi:hypothetical protein
MTRRCIIRASGYQVAGAVMSVSVRNLSSVVAEEAAADGVQDDEYAATRFWARHWWLQMPSKSLNAHLHLLGSLPAALLQARSHHRKSG